MSPTTIYLLFIFSLCIPHRPVAADQSHISLLITEAGLDFVKNVLVSKALSKLTPLSLNEIEKNVKIPVIGKVHIALSNITINRIDFGSSYVKPDDSSISIAGTEVSSELTMKWHYSYGTWLVPVTVSDSGTASIQVNGMGIGSRLGLVNQEGAMKLSVIECNCHIHNITIHLDGGASWLYQGIVNAFGEQIVSLVQKGFTNKLKEVVSELGVFLQNLPKQIHVDDIASLNVTLVNDPFLSKTSLGFEINGLFIKSQAGTLSPRKDDLIRRSISTKEVSGSHPGPTGLLLERTRFTSQMGGVYPKIDAFSRHDALQPPVSCSDPSKMVGIALDQAVFNSAAALYYNAMFLHWVIDKVPEQSLLNTAGWRFIVPQLYKKYPNADMNLEISLSDPPVVKILHQNIDAIVYADLIIDVLGIDEIIPVACIGLVITGRGSVQVTQNILGGHLKLDDFTMSLKWSKIGTLHMFLIQPLMWTIIETVFLPYANAWLATGFPLPIIHGFKLQNTEIMLLDSRITVCSDVRYE